MKHDVVDRLATARPADLDPAPDADRRRRDLEAALASASEPRRARTGRRLAVRRAGLGLSLAAAGTAAAVAIVTLNGGTSTPKGHTPVKLTARSVLLSAAKAAAAEPGGRYWRLNQESGQAYRAGKPGHRYTIMGARWLFDDWTAWSMKDTDYAFGRDLGAKPLTARDRAAWRRAGSPDSFRVWSSDHWDTFSSRNSPWSPPDLITPKQKPSAYPDNRSPQETARLAADPARFQKLMFPERPRPLGKGTDHAWGRFLDGYGFLTQQPVPPEIRAKAFRLLADLPGIRYAGKTTTPDGRTGIALAMRNIRRDTNTVYDGELVLDPKTYKVLGEQDIVVRPGKGSEKGMRPGDLLSYDVVKFVGWTDEKPHHD